MDHDHFLGRRNLGARGGAYLLAAWLGASLGGCDAPNTDGTHLDGTSGAVGGSSDAGVALGSGPTTDGGLAPEAAQAYATSGVNDWNCKPSAAHPRPIVLAHGLGATDQTNWFYHGPRLVKAGYCVFATTYGTGILGPFVGGIESMRTSAAELGGFVDAVLAATGATRVDIVGHSEGTTVPAYYLKFLGGASKVERFVGFGSNYQGTTLGGLSTLIDGLTASAPGLAGLFRDKACAACLEYMPGSDFLADLDRGGVAVPGPSYTNIVSRYDEVVIPYTSGILDAPNVTNIVLQDVCRLDSAGHLGLAIDPNVTALVLRALDPEHAPPVRCKAFTTLGI